MSIVERIKQGGSTINYIIVGLILFAGLIGLVCFVKQRGQTVREEQATVAYEEQQKSSQNSENSKASDNTKSEPTIVVDNEVMNDDKNIVASGELDSDLPQTGPEEVILNTIVIFIVTLSLANYLYSRRRAAGCL